MNMLSFKRRSWALLLLPLLLTDCGSIPTIAQHPLSQEIIKPRPGHDGKLTNQACLEYKGDVCQKWSIKEWDLNDAAIREELNALSFICKIGGRRYKICKDSPGFCRITYSCNFFQDIFGGCTQEIERVPMVPYAFLLDSGTKCFSEKSYSWTEVQ